MNCVKRNIFRTLGCRIAFSAAILMLLAPGISAQDANNEAGEPKPAEASIVRIPADDADQTPELEFVVRPIGYVMREAERTEIFLDKKYEPGLMGLEPNMYIMVFWWFDKNDTPENRRVIQVHPRGDIANPLRGVFATRSPRRPNLLALTCCKVTAVRGNVIEIDKIDAFSGTPVLDIKPYVGIFDSPKK